MRALIILLLIGIAAGFGAPLTAEAHVKWFTELPPQKESIIHIISPLFMFLAIMVAVLLALLAQILPALSEWKLMQAADNKLDQLRKYSILILKYGLAAALTIQVLSGSLFVPEFSIQTQLQTVLLWVAIVLLLIPQHYATKAGALVILYLLIDLTIKVGLFHMLDYGFYLAIACTLLVDKTKASALGFPFLYLGTGLSLCWVAVEKWVYPALAIDIIHQHSVPTFGFAPEAFVVMAAFIEFVVGYLLVVGILNRLLSLVLTGIFVSTTMLFGMTELVGHFMIHVVLLIFIIEGVSFYKPPIKMHKTKLDQMVFVSLNFIFVLSSFVLIYYRFA
ncbi:DoxX family membrane protein [Paenibacillus radicis (ex Xue et al. 2023)]|uniref:DoxX family membrane protein n=1 Tax=Paenibacillus radicis (ex Xue et al. 2023) TaxID=2972489 RepID=A0ABT1YJT1_9BACL|nr:DoxX family membrane protein [Paenibacillus radicis (ex Xue et al. 2023)]MCR8632518.1 DoxX family membrane protein [Paenibacillus radicis (ex Xue et al. 2023)]